MFKTIFAHQAALASCALPAQTAVGANAAGAASTTATAVASAVASASTSSISSRALSWLLAVFMCLTVVAVSGTWQQSYAEADIAAAIETSITGGAAPAEREAAADAANSATGNGTGGSSLPLDVLSDIVTDVGSLTQDSSAVLLDNKDPDESVQSEWILNRKQLNARSEAIKANKELSDADKERSLQAIELGMSLVTRYENLLQEERRIKSKQEQAQDLIVELEQALAAANETYTQEPPEIITTDDVSEDAASAGAGSEDSAGGEIGAGGESSETPLNLDGINALLDQLNAQLLEVQNELSDATSAYNSLQTLPSRAQNLISANNARISKINTLLNSPNILRDETMVLQFEIAVQQKHNEILQTELRSISVFQDVANYKLHIYNLHKDYLSKYLEKVRAAQDELLSNQLTVTDTDFNLGVSTATRSSSESGSANLDSSTVDGVTSDAAAVSGQFLPQVKRESDTNKEIARHIEVLLNDNAQMTREVQEVTAALATTRQIEQNLQEQLTDLSGSVILSRMLNRQQGELPQINISFNLDELIPNLNLWMFDLRNFREQIFDVQSYVNDMVRDDPELAPFSETLVQIMRQRRDLYDQLYNAMSDSLTVATDLRAKYGDLTEASSRVRTMINDHLFWLTSNNGIGLNFFSTTLPRLLLQVDDIKSYLSNDLFTHENTVNYLKIFLPLAILGLIFTKVNPSLKKTANRLAMHLDKPTDGYTLTVRALFLHLFMIIPSVVVITFIGSIFIFITLDNFKDQLMLTYYLTLHVGCFLYMRHILEPNSVVQRYFSFAPGKIARSRQVIDQIWYVSIPMLTIANMRELEPTKIPNDSLGYLLMILGFLYLTVYAGIIVWRTFKQYQPTMMTCTLAVLGICTPLTITLMLCLGYYYTVIQLLNRVAFTLYIGFAYMILSQTLRRTLYVAEIKIMDKVRRMHLQEVLAAQGVGSSSSNISSNAMNNRAIAAANRERNSRAAGNKRSGVSGSGSGLGSGSGSSGGSSGSSFRLELVNNRAYKLFNAIILVVFVYFMYLQWNDLAGVLSYLDEIYLYESVTEVDGKMVTTALSLGDVLLAVIIVMVAVVLNRNLPMLIERLFMLRSGSNAKSAGYTVKLITSYAITTLAVILAAGSLGISWDNLQWLVAALSVGLGFGLQEIFANFVSGIIILFERQLRVGDIVTLDTISGTVNKIRIRATTIISFDNKEVVIPNKQFITSALTNWSLSSTVTKIEFAVGIAYGADINKAKDLLRGIIRRCRDLNRENRPAIYVKSLDPSAVTIMCELYVNEIGKRKVVYDFLSTETLRIFADNNIEIPFDQMDVTVRNIDTDKILHFIEEQNKLAQAQAQMMAAAYANGGKAVDLYAADAADGAVGDAGDAGDNDVEVIDGPDVIADKSGASAASAATAATMTAPLKAKVKTPAK